jgi:hypothetical protein
MGILKFWNNNPDALIEKQMTDHVEEITTTVSELP